MSTTKSSGRTLFVLLLGLYLCLQAYIATIPLEFYDGYDYLTNAVRLIGRDVSYDPIRAPLVSLINLPQIAVWFSGELPFLRVPLSLISSHLVALATSAFFAILCLRLFRMRFDEAFALAGLAMLVMNRMLIHYWSFAMADIPLALFVTLSIYGYIRGWRYSLSLPIAGAMLSKYTGFFLLVVLFFIWLFHRKKSCALWLLISTTLALLIFVAIHLAIYTIAYREFSLDALKTVLLYQVRGDIVQREPASEVLLGLALSSGYTPLFVCSIGLAFSLLSWRREDIPFIIWFISWLIFAGFISSHKETRYFSPLLPPFYYFAIKGLIYLFKRLGKKGGSVSIAVLFIPVILAGGREFHIFFSQPEYRHSYVQRFFSNIEAKLHPPPRRVFWDGPAYPYYPKSYNFYPADEYYYFYHIFAHTLCFISGRKVQMYNESTVLGDGDLLVLNREPSFYKTRTAPFSVKPLKFIRIHRRRLDFERRAFYLEGKKLLKLRDSTLHWTPSGSVRILLLESSEGWSAFLLPPNESTLRLGFPEKVLRAELVSFEAYEVGFRPLVDRPIRGYLPASAFIPPLSYP